MTQIDQFESVFKSAAKQQFRYEAVQIKKVLTVTDLPDYETTMLGDRIERFLCVLNQPTNSEEKTEWSVVSGDQFTTVRELLERIEEHRPDLIVTYRNLHSSDDRWPYSLGEHLDVMTQVMSTPILVLPRPIGTSRGSDGVYREAEQDHDGGFGEVFEKATQNTDSVMAITDHLAGDHHLVNFAVAFTASSGTAYLTHVEDHAIFERYVDAFSKIPTVDTEHTRDVLLKQLLKEPTDYIGSCQRELESRALPITIESIVTSGDHLSDYKKLATEHEVDLLVLNTKDDDQLAMHGMAYPLAVELRDVPLLML